MTDHSSPTSSPSPAVARSQTYTLPELKDVIERMCNVAEGGIQAPPITRQDAVAAIGVCDSTSKAPDLWDGTIDDLAGYLRMMGALIKGMLRSKELLPPINTKPGPPVFDVITKMAFIANGQEQKPGTPIYNVFISGDPTSVDYGVGLSLDYDMERARRKFESTDPAIRDVVGACAALQMAIVIDGAKGNVELTARTLTFAMDKLRCVEASNVDEDTSLAEDEGQVAREDAKVASLQKAIKEKLGVTREELNLDDVIFFSLWRISAALLGIDNYFAEEGSLVPTHVQGALMTMEMCTFERPGYLPPFYDWALYMGSKPNVYPPKKVLHVVSRGLRAYQANGGTGGQPWAELRLHWIAAKAIMAGAAGGGGVASEASPEEDGNQPAVPDIAVYLQIKADLLPHVNAAKQLLERMRPWLGNVAAFKIIEKDVEDWQEKFISGSHEVWERNKAALGTTPMNLVTSQWVARDRDGEKKLRTCASCENSSDKLKACSACKQVWYCNAVCQKAGWKAHKKACIASRKNP